MKVKGKEKGDKDGMRNALSSKLSKRPRVRFNFIGWNTVEVTAYSNILFFFATDFFCTSLATTKTSFTGPSFFFLYHHKSSPNAESIMKALIPSVSISGTNHHKPNSQHVSLLQSRTPRNSPLCIIFKQRSGPS